MRYLKPPLTLEAQADQLLQRGMVGDRSAIIGRLEAVSYYRLSGYWYPFREPNPADPQTLLDTFRPGTTFDEVWARYVFDRHLRLLVMDAIERIEVTVRTRLAYQHAHRYGPFAYATDPTSLPGCKWPEWVDFLATLKRETGRSKDIFAKHFNTKYGDCHSCLPVWMAIEIMTFGSMLTFYRACHPDIRRLVAVPFGVHDTVVDSWLLALHTVRNTCAHHARLWNREWGTKPRVPDRDPVWHTPVVVGNDRTFGILTVCKWSLDRIAPQSRWPDRVRALLAGFPQVPTISMGFPPNWEQCPIWTPPAPAAPLPVPVTVAATVPVPAAASPPNSPMPGGPGVGHV